jgi:hypothetical protein
LGANLLRNSYIVKNTNFEIMRLTRILLVLTLIFSSCVNTRYAYQVEKGKSLDFSSGKWILNKPYTKDKIPHLEDIALQEFGSLLKESLFKIDDLRGEYLISSKPSYDLSEEDLRQLEIVTDANFIINYKVDILNDGLNSLSAVPPIGTSRKINEVFVEISIYGISNAELLSRTSIVGKAKLDISENDSGWDIADTPKVISRKALSKLIAQYRRNKK